MVDLEDCCCKEENCRACEIGECNNMGFKMLKQTSNQGKLPLHLAKSLEVARYLIEKYDWYETKKLPTELDIYGNDVFKSLMKEDEKLRIVIKM